nr:TM1802 family CRISPR-associated protein [Desulforadius tongensis]
MLEGCTSPQTVLSQVSDVGTAAARGFLSRVFVIEIDKRGPEARIAALPVQQWGEYQAQSGRSKKQVFVQEVDRAVGAPFVIPSGGNPTRPQGRYGVPAYPAYERHVKGFIKSAGEAEKFLAGRIDRTIGLHLTDDEIKEAAVQLHKAAKTISADAKDKLLGLVVLAVLEENGPYRLSSKIPRGDTSLAYLGPSVLQKDKYLAAELDIVKERFWEARLAEGAEMGEREGEEAACYFCGARGRVVSSYCKAWPWFTTTWNCPISIKLKNKDLVETTAVCPRCYSALTYGANLFNKLAKPIDNWLTKELFSPSATAVGRSISKMGTPETIFGCAYVLPVLDNVLDDEDYCLDFVDGINSMLNNSPRGNRVDLHLQEITGFELQLPEEMSGDDYRLTIIYYSGDVSRGDIHLRATIEDVVPSVARKLKNITREIGNLAVDTAAELYPEVSEKYRAFLKKCYTSLPYLLSTSYGAPYIWKTLSTVLHRGPISRKRFLLNLAGRMNELSRKLPDYRELNDEVIFYIAFSEFLDKYNRLIAVETGNGGSNLMRNWRELRRMIAEGPVNELSFQNAEELGFAAGYLVRVFSRQYWHASNGKDFIKHRVMTFGSSLTPSAIWKRALARVDEYALKLNMHISNDLRQRFAVVLMEYSRLKDDVNRDKDAFMAAFWAGYALAGDKKEPGEKNE